MNEMDPEEFEQLQAALVASMNQDNEEIVIGEDDDEEGQGGNMMQNFMGMFGFGGGSGGQGPAPNQ